MNHPNQTDLERIRQTERRRALVRKALTYMALASMQPEVPASVRAHYEALERTASDCIGCRGCETRCPFHVPVAERMEKARALFAEGE